MKTVNLERKTGSEPRNIYKSKAALSRAYTKYISDNNIATAALQIRKVVDGFIGDVVILQENQTVIGSGKTNTVEHAIKLKGRIHATKAGLAFGNKGSAQRHANILNRQEEKLLGKNIVHYYVKPTSVNATTYFVHETGSNNALYNRLDRLESETLISAYHIPFYKCNFPAKPLTPAPKQEEPTPVQTVRVDSKEYDNMVKELNDEYYANKAKELKKFEESLTPEQKDEIQNGYVAEPPSSDGIRRITIEDTTTAPTSTVELTGNTQSVNDFFKGLNMENAELFSEFEVDDEPVASDEKEVVEPSISKQDQDNARKAINALDDIFCNSPIEDRLKEAMQAEEDALNRREQWSTKPKIKKVSYTAREEATIYAQSVIETLQLLSLGNKITVDDRSYQVAFDNVKRWHPNYIDLIKDIVHKQLSID